MELHPRLEYWVLTPQLSSNGEHAPPFAHRARLVAEVGRELIKAVVEAATATPGVVMVVEGVEDSTRAPYTRTRGSSPPALAPRALAM